MLIFKPTHPERFVGVDHILREVKFYMQRKHLFIMDPFEKLNFGLDSSLRIAHALSRNGDAAFFCQISDLYWSTAKEPHCSAQPLRFAAQTEDVKLGQSEDLNLNSFATIHMRKDPPFDMNYITATWFLDHSPSATIINHPQALRDFNEKLGTLEFPSECKKALVSAQPQRLLEFVETECKGDAILKPLHLFGGRDIVRIELAKSGKAQALQDLVTATENGTSAKLIQAFDSGIFDGEVRVFLVNGKALSWCLKVPQNGSFLANTRAGAILKTYKPSAKLLTKVTRVAEALSKRGVLFVGMDIISEEISEINITSPRLLVAPGDTRDYYGEIATFLATC